MHEQEFTKAMAEAGLICKDAIVADGHIHRFKNGKSDKTGWYVLFTHAGRFGDWRLGISHKWVPDNQSLSPEQKQAIYRQITLSRKQHEEDMLLSQQRAATTVKSFWDRLQPTGVSRYLQKKQVRAFGIRFAKQAIVIPIRSLDGELWNIQFIYHDGEKRFFRGGKKKGCFHVIGELANSSHIYVCEGYSTACSVYQATGVATIVAFDSGSLDPVIAAIRKELSSIAITIAADNDQWGEYNVGKVKAEEAAKKYDCNVVLPSFPEGTARTAPQALSNPTDFNDLHVMYGLDEVRRQLQKI